jgi:hypothetical protein
LPHRFVIGQITSTKHSSLCWRPIWYDTKDTIMNATKGYYCLVQYCPDIARAEAANVGVVLFSPEHGFIRAKVSDNNKRIRKFFGDEADNYQHLNAMKDALVKRIEVEKAEFSLLENLQQFVETRANKVILTNPKPVKVFDPEEDLQALFKELVDHPEKNLVVRAALPLRKRLDNVLGDVALKNYLWRDLEFQIPTLTEKLTVPYGFQNGRFNLIQPVEFEQQRRGTIINAACKHAIEGNYIYKHPDHKLGEMQLCVVADFTEATRDMAAKVETIFQEYHVRMFPSDTMEILKQEILTKGKPVSSP